MTKTSPNERLYYDTLKRIARHFGSSDYVKRHHAKWGVEPNEALEMAYENIQAEAAAAIRGKRRPPAAPERVVPTPTPIREAIQARPENKPPAQVVPHKEAVE